MSAMPPPLEELGPRPFSFYPPILNIEHNEWMFGRSTWSEMLVVNTKTGMELWIPRRFLGEVSRIEQPVMIVGLNKELEFRAGTVWPTQRRIIEMPRTGAEPATSTPPAVPKSHASGGAAFSSSGPEQRIWRLIGGVLLVAIIAVVILISFSRSGPLRPHVVYTARDTEYLDLNRDDDYFAVVRKLGPPAEDRWKSESGELQYRLLVYPKRSYSVILMGTSRNDARFIGVLDKDWRPLHYLNEEMGSMLRGMSRF
jgi:hypothetical protein